MHFLSTDPYERWVAANVVRGIDRGTISAMAYSRIGDVTTEQFRALADIQRDFNLDVRMTNRQNFVLRDLQEADLTGAHLTGARYNGRTRWPVAFNPERHGAVRVK